MNNKQFYEVWGAAQIDHDRGAFVGDWATSSIFLPPDDSEAEVSPELIDQLGQIWDVAHMSVKDLRATTGLSQVAYAERFCVGRRTVEGWEYKGCPSYVRLMMAECLGLIQR